MAGEFEIARLSALMAEFAGCRILAIGDLMLDEYLWGTVSRISPEAPVPVVNVTGETYYPGGAANVARNLRELIPDVAVMGLAGEDAAGRRLLGLLESCGIETSGVQRDPSYITTVKTRIIARNQQVVRVDRERKAPLTAEQSAAALRHLEGAIETVDAVVVADYGKGFLTQPLADSICRMAVDRGRILTVDPHPHTALRWDGATAIKPNRAEAFLAAGLAPSEPAASPLEDEPLLEAGRRLLDRWRCGSVLVTLGEQGMLLLERGRPALHIPARVKDVFDVSGAGDTALAVFTLALAARGTPAEAAELANRASGIAVGKLGTATVSISEIQAGLSEL